MKFYINLTLIFTMSFFAVTPYAHSDDDHYARGLVIQELELPNKLKVGGSEFKTKQNPKGKGFFVYDPRTDFHGTKRNLIWLTLDDVAYPLNGPSKALTPKLKWPREVSSTEWKKTGLSQFVASEAIKIVFGD